MREGKENGCKGEIGTRGIFRCAVHRNQGL